VLCLILPLLIRFASLNWFSNETPQWTEDDLDTLLVGIYKHVKLQTCNVSIVPLWGMWYLRKETFVSIIATTCTLYIQWCIGSRHSRHLQATQERKSARVLAMCSPRGVAQVPCRGTRIHVVHCPDGASRMTLFAFLHSIEPTHTVVLAHENYSSPRSDNCYSGSVLDFRWSVWRRQGVRAI
jgi:hypothetical protein